MLKLLLVDESLCKKDLDSFVKKQAHAVKMLENSTDWLSRVHKTMEQIQHVSIPKKLAVNTSESLTLLNVNEIVRCESNRNYTYIFMADKKKFIVSKTLMDFESFLQPFNFIRIHKSHLVNLDFIEKYVKSNGGHLVLTDGTVLPVAVRKKEYLFRQFEKIM